MNLAQNVLFFPFNEQSYHTKYAMLDMASYVQGYQRENILSILLKNGCGTFHLEGVFFCPLTWVLYHI